jgi:serine phosphatase RsbU (regulator of sigma subunit)
MTGMKSRAAILEQLRQHPALGKLGSLELDNLFEQSELLHFEPNDLMLQQGTASDCALFIVSGEADIAVETAYGAIHIANGLPKMMIGEIGAFTLMPRIATVRARTDLDALRIGRSQLLELGRANPQFLLFVVEQLGERLSRLNHAIGFYTNALGALERNDFDQKLMDELLHPMPELADFSQSFLRLAEQITVKRRHFEEMANAAAIQRAMLPRAFRAEKTFAAIDLYGELHPAREVGGDFFDYFTIDDARLVVTIGDVSGKGIPAALFMAITQSLVRLTLREDGDLAAQIARVNSLLAADNTEAMFATAFCAIVDIGAGCLTYSNCGHNAPLLLRRDGMIERLGPTGPPLAAAANVQFRTASRPFDDGDGLVLFSDGLPEATNRVGEFFGDDNVERTVREHATSRAQALVRGLLSRAAKFEDGAPRYDDIACVALIYRRAESHSLDETR